VIAKFKTQLRARNWLGADVLGLLLVGLLVGGLDVLWASLEQRPPHWDMARHLYNSLGYLDMLRHHEWRNLVLNYAYYPPLLYYLALPWYLVLGTGVAVAVAVASNLPAIWLLLLSVYGLGRYLWGREVGWVAAVVTVATPMVASQFKEFQLDAPTTALAMAALYALARSREFSRPWWSWLTGVAVGVGLLCKWTFGLILGAPLLMAAGMAVAEAMRERRLGRLSGVVQAALWAYVIPSAWYIFNNKQLQIDLLNNGVGAGAREGDPVVGSWASAVWYGINLVNVQLYLLLAVGLAVGVVVALRHRREWYRRRYLLVAALGIYASFTLLRNKDPRYTLALVPVVVLLGCAGLKYARGWTRRLWAGGLVAYSVVTFMVMSFGGPGMTRDVKVGPPSSGAVVWGPHGYIIGPPSGEDWALEPAFQLMAAQPGPVAYNGIDTIWCNNWDILYLGRKYRLPVVSDQEAARYLLYRAPASAPGAPAPWRLRRQADLPDHTRFFVYERS
jgi:4-amino-4-deoxy-L-arabinose transferase-like glycosyltransferase